MKKTLLIVLVTILSFSCSTPLDKKYSEETFETDIKEIKESKKLSDEDALIMAGWIMRSKFKGENLEDKTYNEIIKEAKDYRKEQELLAEKAKLEEEEKRQRLGSALTVAMYDKGYREQDYQEYLTYSFAFENKTEKDIRAFKGSISIQDLFETEIKSINLTIDDQIKAGETFKGTYTTGYNQFIDDDTRLKSKDMEDLKVVWTPEKIIFSDGTTLK
ncbi:hypothetical protein DFQ09_102313 [Winogradskyella pacifica]|uniref:Lipoprotein n=1 Tax=Winogradskyella pacifica TaxID=664642 RepID=A0A3D9MZT3_9FLAO|nr:hypothetical protein [Winogradskyella pacifica]REE25722.1 hypothetical protein DFQ09_102313 [Winogradskyella pacifica]